MSDIKQNKNTFVVSLLQLNCWYEQHLWTVPYWHSCTEAETQYVGKEGGTLGEFLKVRHKGRKIWRGKCALNILLSLRHKSG